jgi:hypothetical protein
VASIVLALKLAPVLYWAITEAQKNKALSAQVNFFILVLLNELFILLLNKIRCKDENFNLYVATYQWVFYCYHTKNQNAIN